MNFNSHGLFGADTFNPLDTRTGLNLGSSTVMTIHASIPVEEWSSDAQFLAAVPVQKVAFLKDVKSSGSTAGGFTSGSYVERTLNTVEGDTGIVSLASNKFTLQSGEYLIEGEAPAYAVNTHKAKVVQDPSGSPTDVILGQNSGAVSTGAMTSSIFKGKITVAGSTTFNIQHRCSVTKATNGLGDAATFGDNELYTQVKITKLR